MKTIKFKTGEYIKSYGRIHYKVIQDISYKLDSEDIIHYEDSTYYFFSNLCCRLEEEGKLEWINAKNFRGLYNDE